VLVLAVFWDIDIFAMPALAVLFARAPPCRRGGGPQRRPRRVDRARAARIEPKLALHARIWSAVSQIRVRIRMDQVAAVLLKGAWHPQRLDS